jgi:hypothetical protein
MRRILMNAMVLGLVLGSGAGAADPGLLCWWTLDGNLTNSGSTGGANNGTGVGSPTFAAGKLGQALSLSGASQYADCGTLDLSTNGTGGISLCAWINRPAAGVTGDHKIVGNRNGNAGFKMSVYGNPARLEMEIYDAAGQLLTRTGSTPAGTGLSSADTWYHVACVFDDTAGEVREYVNGVLDATTATTKSLVSSTGTLRIGAEIPTANYYFNGLLDDVRIYSRVVSVSDLQIIMKGGDKSAASNSSPADKATDIPRDVVLAWTPGEFAKTHNVYFGTAFDDVNSAGVANPKGVLVSRNQDANTYDPIGVLQYGQTYYWRVDEVNAPPTDSTIFKGSVSSFTVEAAVYTMMNITATASSSYNTASGPEKTINGIGLNAADQHSTDGTQMWISGNTGQQWIQYQFDGVYKLQQMWVWNSNQAVEAALGFGVKTATVEYSIDGVVWTALANVPEFAQAPGQNTYVHDTTIDFGGVAAQFVKITPTAAWGGRKQCSLSEVRFFYTPVLAREPRPATGAAAVNPNVTLRWRAGREAVSHQVYLGTDPNALAVTATAAVNSYTPAGVNLGTTYYWKIAEVNNAEAVGTWMGSVWSFTTAGYLVVDDMESYDDKQGTSVFDAWADGYLTTTNGAQVGYGTPANGTFCDATIFNGGKQSMPFIYGVTSGTTNSETVRTFADARDWTLYGIKGLSLLFYGDPANAAVQFYVKINGTKVVYTGKAEDIKRAQWQPFNVDLSKVPASVLKSVTKLAIGIDGAGSGKLLIDDIRLYPSAGELVTPVNPGTTGLLAWYKFDGDLKDSVGGFNGTAVGDAKITTDTTRSQVLSLDGVDDAVSVPKIAENGTSLTIAVWANTSSTNLTTIQYASLFHTTWVAGGIHFRYGYGKIQCGFNGPGDLTGISIIQPNQWYHAAVTVSPTGYALWLNGLKEASMTYATPVSALIGNGYIGAYLNGTAVDREFTGMIDDVRFYNRPLSQAELGWLAGRTESFANRF